MAIQSVEPNVADKINSELKSYKLDYKLEQESLNQEIDNALLEYASKGGGKGGNRPDAKLLLQDSSLNFYPILIEYKGYEDKLEKLDTDGNIENRTAKNEPNFKGKNMKKILPFLAPICLFASSCDELAQESVREFYKSDRNLARAINLSEQATDACLKAGKTEQAITSLINSGSLCMVNGEPQKALSSHKKP